MATPNDNNHAAIPMRSATTDSKTRIELRTQEQPPVAEHRGGTHYARNDPSRTRRTQEVPFNAGCNHFSRRKNTRFRAPASSPSQVSHQPSLSVLFCDVRSHTTVSHHPSLSVLLCDPSLTPQTPLSVLLQIRVMRNSEDCFPTRLKNIHHHVAM